MGTKALTGVPIMGIIVRMNALASYMDREGLDDQSMADRLGLNVSPWAVRKWRYGQRVPRPKMLARLREATDGAVTPNDFIAAHACVVAEPRSAA